MLFNSYPFLVFLVVILPIFFWSARFGITLAAAWLAVASLAFYAVGESLSAGLVWGERHALLFVASIAFNYIAGLVIFRAATPGARRWWLSVAVVTDLALLGYFKYANFLLSGFGLGAHSMSILLPLGISFFTFTQIAYLVDISRGQVKEFNPVHYALFVTYFPHLIAGPIIHHAEMIPQFQRAENYRCRVSNLATGLSVFAFGLAKKALLADWAAPYADRVFAVAGHAVPSAAESWVGALTYTIQIYFDFSAYSDMAIGLALMIGFRLPLNFNSPYKSASIIEFWRRWHMTLSRFLRDYLYIPLGGSRRGPVRRYVNLLLTMLLGGLWHGAGLTFLIWGGLHGLYLVINHAWRRLNWHLPTPAGVVLTSSAVIFAWVFFRADSLEVALAVIRGMLGLNPAGRVAAGVGTGSGLFPNTGFEPLSVLWVTCVPLLIAWAMPNVQQLFAARGASLDAAELSPPAFAWRPSPWWAIACGALFAAGVIAMAGSSPFLYFRF